jgi:hypothetical protein
LLERLGVLSVQRAFFLRRPGVVTGMIVQSENQVTMNMGSIRLEAKRGAIGGESPD